MCGIAGYVAHRADTPVDGATIARMLETLRYRGPDGEGIHVAPGIGLGMRRLAIVDLVHGEQPLANEDGSVLVVCNGEIYDAPETRAELVAAGHAFGSTSDAEVAVHLYEQHGLDFVRHLRGMFALALWDARRRRLVLARDRFAMKPLCYHESRGGLWFASEAKAIVAACDLERRLDPDALRDLTTLGFLPTPRTMFTGIRQLPAGHLLVHEAGRVRIERYWEIDFPARAQTARRRSDRDWIDALRDKLTESVRLHMRSDVPVGVLLSGGLDSSSVASLMCRLAGAAVPSYSVGFDEPVADELRRRRMLYEFPEVDLTPHSVVACAADLQHLPWAVWCTEDASSAIASALWRLPLAALAARDVKVVLTGEGADEVLGGYPWYHGQKLLGPLARLPRTARRALLVPLLRRFRPGLARLLCAPDAMGVARFSAMMSPRSVSSSAALLAPDVRALLERSEHDEGVGADASMAEVAVPEGYAGWHPIDQLHYLDLTLRLASFVNHGLDRATMAFSLEARLPFLDHQLFELCATIPRRLRMRWLEEKHVLRRAMRGIVPREILARRKRGTLSPIAEWLRAPRLPDAVAEALAPDRVAATGYFAAGTVRALLDRHRAGVADHSHELLTVAGVQLWHEQFVAGRGAPERPRFGGSDHRAAA
jgi:asparagine synthase (glutamine-hydrolysing)